MSVSREKSREVQIGFVVLGALVHFGKRWKLHVNSLVLHSIRSNLSRRVASFAVAVLLVLDVRRKHANSLRLIGSRV